MIIFYSSFIQSHSMLLLEVAFLPVWLPASIDYNSFSRYCRN